MDRRAKYVVVNFVFLLQRILNVRICVPHSTRRFKVPLGHLSNADVSRNFHKAYPCEVQLKGKGVRPVLEIEPESGVVDFGAVTYQDGQDYIAIPIKVSESGPFRRFDVSDSRLDARTIVAVPTNWPFNNVLFWRRGRCFDWLENMFWRIASLLRSQWTLRAEMFCHLVIEWNMVACSESHEQQSCMSTGSFWRISGQPRGRCGALTYV